MPKWNSREFQQRVGISTPRNRQLQRLLPTPNKRRLLELVAPTIANEGDGVANFRRPACPTTQPPSQISSYVYRFPHCTQPYSRRRDVDCSIWCREYGLPDTTTPCRASSFGKGSIVSRATGNSWRASIPMCASPSTGRRVAALFIPIPKIMTAILPATVFFPREECFPTGCTRAAA